VEDMGVVKLVVHLSSFVDREYSGVGQQNYILYVGVT
jgi:hypothetical protein